MNFDVANIDVWDGVVLPVTTPAVGCLVRLALRMSFAPKVWTVLIDRDIQYAGRCQVGDDLWLSIQSIGQTSKSSGIVLPDASPVVRIYATPSLPVRTIKLPIDHSSGGSRGVFRGAFRPGGTDTPGRYWALVLYQTKGLIRSGIASFEVVPGGHRHGAVMTTFNMTKPSGSSFLAHQEAGVVTRGLRPYLDRGD